jgi:hypothetical protein
MPFSNYPNGFGAGVAVRGMPLLNTYGGNVFWVDSGSGSNGNKGTHDQPFGTIDYAVGRCTASNGDMLMVKAGHVETVIAAAGLAFDVIGVTVVGLGRGDLRPQVNFTTDVGASMVVSAAQVAIHNVRFTGGFDALTGPMDIQAADCLLSDIVTQDVTGQATDFIVTTAAADGLVIDGWVHKGAAAAGADTALSIVGGAYPVVKNFWIDGNFAVAAIENVTTACTNATITEGYIRTRNAADVAITMVATSTGNIGPNINIRIQDNAANITEALVGADMQFFQPLPIVNLDGEVGLNSNIVASTDA